MKVKIFQECILYEKILECKINEWLISNNIEIIDVKMSATEGDRPYVIITFLYEDIVDVCVELDEFGNVINTLKS